MMVLSDPILRDLFTALDVASQRALAMHIMFGATSPESWAALRWLRRRLKRRAYRDSHDKVRQKASAPLRYVLRSLQKGAE